MADDLDVSFRANSDGTVDITAKQGATWTIPMQMKNDDDTPYDLTGWNFRGQVRRSVTSTTVVAAFSFEETDLANGQVTAVMSAADSADIPCKESLTDNQYTYDMERYQGSPEVVRKDLPRGKLYVIAEVTK